MFVPCTIHGHHDAAAPEARSCEAVVAGKTYRARFDAETEALYAASHRQAS